MNDPQFILYTTEDGRASVELQAADGTVWLNQMELSELFQTTQQNISLHIQNILEDNELDGSATVKEPLTVQVEGSRRIQRRTLSDNLEMILAVGYRVRSPRGTSLVPELAGVIMKMQNHLGETGL